MKGEFRKPIGGNGRRPGRVIKVEAEMVEPKKMLKPPAGRPPQVEEQFMKLEDFLGHKMRSAWKKQKEKDPLEEQKENEFFENYLMHLEYIRSLCMHKKEAENILSLLKLIEMTNTWSGNLKLFRGNEQILA